jgi:hypothetical protein
MFENLIFFFDVFKKVQAYIPSVFLVFIGEVFGTSFAQIFRVPKFLDQKVVNG